MLEYTLSPPYDLTTLSLVTTAGIKFDGLGASGSNENVQNPAGMRFSANGKRIFIISHNGVNAAISQISLTNAERNYLLAQYNLLKSIGLLTSSYLNLK